MRIDYLYKNASFVFFLFLMILTSSARTQTRDIDHILYLQLPKSFYDSDNQVRQGITNERLIAYSLEQLRSSVNTQETRKLDRIVVFTDENRRVIRGKSTVSTSSTITPNRISNELSYTFYSPIQPWSVSDSLLLSSYVKDFYPEIKKLMGNPFFNISINIRRDTTIAYAGLYFPSLNEMVLHHPAADIVCHESIHAFRDDFVMVMSSFEEGLTRACEIEIFNRLIKYQHPFDENHSYPYDYYYESLNRPSISALMGNIFLNPSLQFLKYQISSYVWAKPFLEDSSFFRRFNDALYSRMTLNPSVPPLENELKTLFLSLKSQIEGLPSSIWYQRQNLLNSQSSPGYYLLQRVNEFSVNYFQRTSSAEELPQAGSLVSWKQLNYFDTPLNNGELLSSFSGDVFLPVSNGLVGYQGKISVIATVNTPLGLLSDTCERAIYPNGERGIFGVVSGESGGLVFIRPLDTLMGTLSRPVINGSFEFPELENVKGRFRVSFLFPECQEFSRIYTKDRSKYFVQIKRNNKNYWTGAVDSLWHNPLNWSSGSIPNDCTDVVISSSVSRPCVIASPAICRTLIVQSGAVLNARRSILVRL